MSKTLAFIVMIVLFSACIPAHPQHTIATDREWCRRIEERGWLLGSATQGMGAMSASLAVLSATTDSDTALWLSISGAAFAAAGVVTSHLAGKHTAAYAQTCGPGPATTARP